MFNRLLEYWNEDKGTYTRSEKIADYVSKCVGESFRKQFLDDKPFEKHTLRMSQIGKPLILLCLHKIGYLDLPSTNFKQDWIFSLGDVVEAYLMSLVHMCGYVVESPQLEVELYDIKGHIDFLSSRDTVVEVKSMSDSYFRQFTKQPDDDRGYLTQLHMYCAALGTKRGVWLCLNKGTNELAQVNLGWDDGILQRSRAVVKAYNDCDGLDYIVQNVNPPDGVPERKGGVLTGRFIVPTSMRYSEYARAFYDMQGQYLISYKPNWYKEFEG